MGIANKTILNRMESELLLAIEKEKSNPKIMLQHIAKVHLLCELLLEDHEIARKDKRMISMLSQQKKDENKEESIRQSSINHNGANGDSIFDF